MAYEYILACREQLLDSEMETAVGVRSDWLSRWPRVAFADCGCEEGQDERHGQPPNEVVRRCGDPRCLDNTSFWDILYIEIPVETKS